MPIPQTTFRSWNAYQNLMASLSIAPTGNLARRAMPIGQPLTFRVAHATVPYTNTPTQASSTFVRNIRYMPNANVSWVRLGTKDYWYPMSLRRLSNWLNSRSLGQYYNRYIKLK